MIPYYQYTLAQASTIEREWKQGHMLLGYEQDEDETVHGLVFMSSYNYEFTLYANGKLKVDIGTRFELSSRKDRLQNKAGSRAA